MLLKINPHSSYKDGELYEIETFSNGAFSLKVKSNDQKCLYLFVIGRSFFHTHFGYFGANQTESLVSLAYSSAISDIARTFVQRKIHNFIHIPPQLIARQPLIFYVSIIALIKLFCNSLTHKFNTF